MDTTTRTVGAPTVEVLLHGYSAAGDQGSLGLGSVHLVTAPAPDGTVTRIVFDCGHLGRRRALLGALAARDLAPADVDVLVLSHGHWDHVQNADLFTAARVLVHPAELRYLAAPAAGDHATPPWAGAILAGLRVTPTGEGDEPAPGTRVIELPGHTAGSIGLVVATGGVATVLTGDAVSGAESVRTGRCSNVFHDAALADGSIARVRDLAAVVHPGHDRPFRVERDGAVRYLTDAMPPLALRVADPEAWRGALRFERRAGGGRFVLPGASDGGPSPA